MKVLIFTATYGKGPEQECVDSINAQVSTAEFEHEISWHNTYPEGDLRNVTAQMNRGRELVLAGNYDAMLAVEHDMLLPPDALQKLLDVEAPVAYGVYVFRHGVPVLNTYEKYPGKSKNVGESLSLKPKKLQGLVKQGVIEVSGIGFGCTLIRRNVLEQIVFRHRDSDKNGTDYCFAEDCLRADIRQLAHFGVQCGHWNGQKWIMPFSQPIERNKARVGAILEAITALGLVDAAGAGLVKIQANQRVVARIGTESVLLHEGDQLDVPWEDADNLVRGGYASRVS